MASSKRGAFSRALRAARLEGEAVVRAAVKAEADLVLVPELVEVAVLVAASAQAQVPAARAVVLLQWLPAR